MRTELMAKANERINAIVSDYFANLADEQMKEETANWFNPNMTVEEFEDWHGFYAREEEDLSYEIYSIISGYWSDVEMNQYIEASERYVYADSRRNGHPATVEYVRTCNYLNISPIVGMITY